MSVLRFQDHIFLQYKTHIFVYEPSWDMYRPIDGVAWNGREWVIQDREYCKDPFDSLYGYGRQTMHEVCDVLTNKFQEEEGKVVPYPSLGKLEWFRDRYVMLTPCAPRDTGSWKQLHRGRVRTGKNRGLRNKFTRRNI